MGGRILVDGWLGRVGLLRRSHRRDGACGETGADQEAAPPRTVGVLALEVAALLCKLAHLWRSLADAQIARLRDHVLRLEGVRKLVSDDPGFLLSLALSEMLDALAAAARSAALLCRRCSVPALRRLDRVLPDIATLAVARGDGGGLRRWAFTEKKMDRKVIGKMDRLAAATVHLYQEIDMEQRSLQAAWGNNTGGASFPMDLMTQTQELKTLWNRTYDYVVRLLARSLFTLAVRINLVFGFHRTDVLAHTRWLPTSTDHDPRASTPRLPRSCFSSSGPPHHYRYCSGGFPTLKPAGQLPPLPGGGGKHATRWSVSGRGPFRGCMVDGGSSPAVLQQSRTRTSTSDRGYFTKSSGRRLDILPPPNDYRRTTTTTTRSRDAAVPAGRSSSLQLRPVTPAAPESTLGASALALHYARLVIAIEKLAASPHLIGPGSRDDLYRMLPTSVRAALRGRLRRPYAHNSASSALVYDPLLAAEWGDILEWLPPLAHNTIRWHSERNPYEQQRCRVSNINSNANVLLLHTLYFANQAKTEAAIVELLVGLNYLWRFARHQMNDGGRTGLPCRHHTSI